MLRAFATWYRPTGWPLLSLTTPVTTLCFSRAAHGKRAREWPPWWMAREDPPHSVANAHHGDKRSPPMVRGWLYAMPVAVVTQPGNPTGNPVWW